MTRKTLSKVIAAALATSLSVTTAGLALPAVAVADESSSELQAKLDAAKSKMNDLYSQAEEASEKLNDTKVKLQETKDSIKQTKKDIEAKKEELQTAQDTLSERVAANYKSGGVSLLEIVLQSSSFEELANNLYYAQKVNENDEEAINTVKTVQQELSEKQESLEKDQKEQEQLVKDQEEQTEALQSKASEAESYVNSLDEKVQKKLAEEQAAAEAEAKAKAEAEAAQAAANAAKVQNNTSSNSSNGGSSNSGSSSKGNSGGSSSGGSASSSARSTIVSFAYSKIGCAYVWGAEGPSAYDCSGFVQACYAAAGIYVPHSSAALASYCNKSASQAVAGDIVWRSGHVGICIGGGRTIEAMSPSQGVTYGSVSDFVSAGSVG